MKRIILVLAALLVYVSPVHAQDEPWPNVVVELPDGWYASTQANGSLMIANDEAALTNTFGEPLPDGVVAMAIGTSFDMPSFDFTSGGDYLLGQMATIAARIAISLEQELDMPQLERIPELNSNGFTYHLDAIPADFWNVAVPTFPDKNYVMFVMIKGDFEAHREDIIAILLSLELNREVNL